MKTYISSKSDLVVWAENHLDVDSDEAHCVADAIWRRPDFPHPVSHSDLTDYLSELPEDYLIAAIDAA